MTGALDEDAAWHLLLELEPGAGGTVGPLRVDDDGSWSATVPVTDAARTLLDVFAPIRVRRAIVVGQLGQSLDGRIATERGDSHYINGPEDLRRLHRLRALVQAVVVGAGTVSADDPRLTVRHVDGPNPVRVVLDPSGRLPDRRTVFEDRAAPTLVVHAPTEAHAGTGPEAKRRQEGAGLDDPSSTGASVEELILPFSDEGFDPHAILAALAERGLRRVLVEGGGITVSRFLEARALDRLHVSVAPLVLGSGRPSITLPTIDRLDEALRPPVRHFRLGTDLLFDLELDASRD